MPWFFLALGALVAVAGGAAWWAWQRRRSRAAQGRPKRAPAAPRYPVVLAHGIMGFDVIRIAGRKTEYFRGVPGRLRRLGAEVHIPRVPPAAGIAQRAGALAACIGELDATRVNVVAHSMGGLDARYAISKLGLAPRVASLITIGTPHRGTAVADVGASLVGDRLGLKRALGALGVDVSAFYDITTSQMASFNREVEDVRGVTYASFEARVRARFRGLHPLLIAPYLFLSEQAGANDGLVPAASQRWGELWGEIDADHWAQIGWSRRFDAPAFYARVLSELRHRGL